MTPTRLFDSVALQLKDFPKDNMLVSKVNGNWKPYSTREVSDIVDKFSAGLMKLGVSGNDYTVEQADKIAIISNNRPEWVFTDLAVQQTGAILVPLYPTTSPIEITYILNDAQVKYIFVSNGEMHSKISQLLPDVPSLQKIYSFDEINGVAHWTEILAGVTTSDIEKVESIKNTIGPEQVATIIYTSGTTGTPKGVMLTHKNIVSNVLLSKESFPFPNDPGTKVLSFLPLNHIFEKTVTYIYLFSGIGIYYAESLETIGDNLKEIKPDGFTTVPRLLEKVFEKIMATGSNLKGIKRSLFFWAVKLGKRYDNRVSGGWLYNLQLALANKIIFSKWREALGGNVSFIITGGAACQEMLLRIFNAAKIPVYEGYGPTEHSPVICVNRKHPEGLTKFGTVGPPINGIEVKLADDGEVLCKGPCVMKGYYKRPDLTAETIIDGWLHTGDIAEWDENKFLKITDRKKELIKTSGGKYVAPQALENKFKESPFIEQIMVVGEGKKFVSALIVPSASMLKSFMEKEEMTYNGLTDAVTNKKVVSMFKDVVERLNQNFNHVEQVKKFVLLPKEWSVETGEMTPKLSLKRKIILQKFSGEIEEMYKE